MVLFRLRSNSLRKILKVFTRSISCEPYVYPWCVQVYDNCMRAVKEQTCSSFESIVLLVEAGSRYEVDCNHGVTYFLEHLFDKGNTCMNECQLSTYLQSIQTRMWSNTCRTLQELTFIVPADYVENIIYYLPTWVFELDPTEETIKKTKEVIKAQLIDHERDLKSLTSDYLHNGAYSGSGLSKPVIGPVCTMANFNKDFLLKYLCHNYQPQRMVIAASGPTPIDRFFEMVGNSFGCLPPTASVPYTYDKRFTGCQVMYRNDDLPYTYCMLAVEAPGYEDKRYMGLRLLKHLVGSYNPSRSGGIKTWPITAQASELGRLTVNYEAFYRCYRDTGLWGIYFVSDVLATEYTIQWIQKTLVQISTMVTHNEFLRAQNALRQEVAQEMCCSMSSARIAAIDMMYLCKRHTIKDWYDQVDSLTLDYIMNIAQDIFYDQEVAIAGVGKTEPIWELSRMRANQYWLRL